MIWQVIKKDFRSLWWLGPVLAAAAIGYAYSLFSQHVLWLSTTTDSIVVFWPYLAAGLALARMVQLDSPAILRGDWHTRPASRWSILAAKAMVAAGCVVVPWALINLAWNLSWRVAPADALPEVMLYASEVGCGLVLVIALASATQSLVPLLIVLAFGLSAGMLIEDHLFWRLLAWLDLDRAGTYSSFGLQIATIWAGGAMLLAAILLLYHRRRLAAAWAVMLFATLGVELCSLSAGHAFFFTWPANIAEPAAARGVEISVAGAPIVRVIDASPGRPPMAAGNGIFLPSEPSRPSQGTLSIPLTIEAPAGMTLEVDRRRVDRTIQGERTITFMADRGGVLGWDLALGSPPVPPSASQRVNARYRLYVRQTLPSINMSSDDPVSLPGGGSCRWSNESPFYLRSLPERRLMGTLACVSATPLCLDIARAVDPGPGLFGSGCGLRSHRGFYLQRVGLAAPSLYPVSITRNQVLGVIDRSLATGWFTPKAEPFQKTSPPQLAKPAPSPAKRPT
ncbi:MAG: hypothetical protein JWM33_26 [Caulobacteraceae bacterium]|nr:hypothetical protein [Caulobacteraceae bacterium]